MRIIPAALFIHVLTVSIDDSTAHAGQNESSMSTSGVTIGFDDAPGPCLFADSNPLGDRYHLLGVDFSGPDSLDGGAIVEYQCATMVTGFSPPNFLAFSGGGSLANGGVPIGPERLTFTSPVTDVSMKVGSTQGGTVTVRAYNRFGLLATRQVSLTKAVQEVRIATQAIEWLIISSDQPLDGGHEWMLDDLSFDFDPVSTQARTWGRLKSIYR
jgi:hypothetical protein